MATIWFHSTSRFKWDITNSLYEHPGESLLLIQAHTRRCFCRTANLHATQESFIPMAERPRRQTKDSHSLQVIKSRRNKCNVSGDTKQRAYMKHILKAVMVVRCPQKPGSCKRLWLHEAKAEMGSRKWNMYQFRYNHQFRRKFFISSALWEANWQLPR